MNVEVRYYSKSGNTKKLADAIASAVNVTAQTTMYPIKNNTDILFLGSSVYAAGVDNEIKKYIASLDPNKVKKVVNFSTAALLPSTYKQVKELVEAQGIEMSADEYHCKGSFGLMHRNKPNADDLKAVSEFAKKVVG